MALSIVPFTELELRLDMIKIENGASAELDVYLILLGLLQKKSYIKLLHFSVECFSEGGVPVDRATSTYHPPLTKGEKMDRNKYRGNSLVTCP